MALADAVASAVGAWTLDEASGTRADQVNTNDLTDNNTVGSASGQFGNAGDFESSASEYLSHTSNATLQMGDIDFMVRAWIYLESTGNMTIVGKDDGGGSSRDYTLDLLSGTPRFYINGGAGLASWGSALSTGTWYLIHGWHNAAANQVGIAVNAGTAITGNTFGAAPNTSSAEFCIGRRPYTGFENYFDGLIDDVVLLKNYILDATERTEDYNSGTGVAFADWGGGGGGATTSRPPHRQITRFFRRIS